MTSPLSKPVSRAALASDTGDRPPPAVYTSGSDRVVVSFVAPASFSVVYTTAQATLSTRNPIAFSSVRPAAGGARPLVDALEIAPAMRTAIQGELLATTRPTSRLAASFFDAQRHIFVESFTCDPMDDGSIVRRPT